MGHARISWAWPNFTKDELSCKHCGEYYHDELFLDKLQKARTSAGRPFHILSAHRCAIWNARIGGAPLSQHKKIAADIALYNHDKMKLLNACADAGFTGFGYYQNFLHVDTGRPRFWFAGEKARAKWVS